jgi:hypothetical protein
MYYNRLSFILPLPVEDKISEKPLVDGAARNLCLWDFLFIHFKNTQEMLFKDQY